MPVTMDFGTLFKRVKGKHTVTAAAAAAAAPIPTVKPHVRDQRSPPAISGLEYERKGWFDEILPSLREWGQNVMFLGQSNMGKSFFLKKLLDNVQPERLVVIFNTPGDQYRMESLKSFKHYSTLPENIGEMNIEPHTYVIIDDIRVMALKHGEQRECL